LMAKAMAPVNSSVRVPLEDMELDSRQDPRIVLRRLAKEFIPFIEKRFTEQIAWWMHARTAQDAQRIADMMQNPFGSVPGPTPPQRVLAILEDYFKRINKAGWWRLKDPKAAALLFLGSLHSYVTLHRLLRIMDPPMALDRYLDTLFDIWSHGARKSRRNRK
jgi:hypothetical protein